ncbi:MAG: energy transducer TonB [Deltaproteobacteria bacterium]|jgi:protein TonB|nr:energy transducer TonB [Deltaproteobacteria bacterium]MDL1986258.1 energy transducer TonB [Deltaproteobacteria bacterium]
MNIRHYNDIFISLGVALLINIFLFAFLPNFVKSDFSKNDLETLVPVHLVQIRPQKPLPEKEEKLPEKKPPEKVISTVRLQHKVPKKQEIKMEMPRLSFEINPKLAGGMLVAPQTTFKDFYDQSEVDRMPMAIFKMKPIYPYRARRLNIAGKVDVKFLVDEKGCVSNIKILKSTPPGIFDESVHKALASWRFSPGELDGRAVSTWVVTTIEFDMEAG